MNKWISKRSRDVARKFEISVILLKNDRFIQIMYKPEISRTIN